MGLFVIDEEQRFGVRHKEKLKKLRRVVDVLTLTATPIPRTLHLSLSGIRDISIISTPPEYRRSIITYVSEYNDGFVKILIRDTGVGIPEDKLSCLFTIEESFNTKGTRGEEGTGLGLIICKEFVWKNGGDIYAESEDGKGTTFIVTLPVKE